MVVLIASALAENKTIDVVLYVMADGQFPLGLKIKQVSGLREAILDSNKTNVDYLVFTHSPISVKEKYFNNIPTKTGLIVWCHNFISNKWLSFYANCKELKSIICVGREMLDLYVDHKAYTKMDYIYNGFPFADKEILMKKLVDVQKRENIVTYIGSIVPSKSFHWLAKAWKNVLKMVPDAQLYVIGNGNLYNGTVRLGKYHIAEESYEKVFMPYLTDDQGNILPSVHFMGKLGIEKNEIIAKTKVGVPNPSGYTETFGLTAVEMETLGCVVVSYKCPGYIDTVVEKRNLYSNPRKISAYIIKNLLTPKINFCETYDELKDKFYYEHIVVDWIKLFEALHCGNCKIHGTERVNIFYNHKWFRIFWGKINASLGYILPTEVWLSGTRFYTKYIGLKKKLQYKLVK